MPIDKLINQSDFSNDKIGIKLWVKLLVDNGITSSKIIAVNNIDNYASYSYNVSPQKLLDIIQKAEAYDELERIGI